MAGRLLRNILGLLGGFGFAHLALTQLRARILDYLISAPRVNGVLTRSRRMTGFNPRLANPRRGLQNSELRVFRRFIVKAAGKTRKKGLKFLP
jgi:hypothetical protein